MAVPYYSEGNTDRNAPSQHPISPPQELRDKWLDEASDNSVYDYLIDKSSQWGADQELEACREWISKQDWAASSGSPVPAWTSAQLLAARRPKPQSLKRQALDALTRINAGDVFPRNGTETNTIRQALETLPDE